MLGPITTAPLLAAAPIHPAYGLQEKMLPSALLYRGFIGCYSFLFCFLIDLGIPNLKEGIAFCLLLILHMKLNVY